MYIRCDNCNWSQDDFYSDSYNPARYLLDWNEYLIGDKREQLDQQFSSDSEFIRVNGDITTREVLAREYEKFANSIRIMKWVTYEDYDRDVKLGIAVCPKCGSSEHFSID